MVYDLTSAHSERTGRGQQNSVLIALLAGNPLIPTKFIGSLQSLGSID